MNALAWIGEVRIAQAVQDRKLDNLPGAGRALDLTVRDGALDAQARPSAPRAGLRPARPPRGMRPAAPSCPAAAWTAPNPSSLQAARRSRKLGAALRFLERLELLDRARHVRTDTTQDQRERAALRLLWAKALSRKCRAAPSLVAPRGGQVGESAQGALARQRHNTATFSTPA